MPPTMPVGVTEPPDTPTSDPLPWTHYRARIAGLSRDREPDDPELIEARHGLKVAKLEDHIRKVVESWPQLTPEQVDRLRGLLRGGAA